MSKKINAFIVVDELGEVIPWSADSTEEGCDAGMYEAIFREWEDMKKHGAKIVPCKITVTSE